MSKEMQQKIYLLEKRDLKQNDYTIAFTFAEIPKNFILNKLFNNEITLNSLNDEDFKYIDIIQETNYAEYSLSTRMYEHLGHDDVLYIESVTCFDCSKITLEEAKTFIEEHITYGYEDLITCNDESVIYANIKEELEDKSIKVMKQEDTAINSMMWCGKGVYILNNDTSGMIDVEPLDKFIDNNLVQIRFMEDKLAQFAKIE